MNRILFFIILGYFYPLGLFAQNEVNSDSTTNLMAYNKFVIPVLEDCIQFAMNNSPLLKANDQQIEVLLEEIKIKKKAWLDFIQIEANTRYGLFNQVSLTQSSEVSASEVALQSAKEQFNYFAGLTVKLPLSYFVANKSEQKIIKLNIREMELKKEDLKKEITRLVIIEYFKLKNFSEMLEAQQNNLQTAQIDYLKGRNDVKSGMIGMTEYAAISNAYTKSMDAYISTKNSYYTEYYLLKMLTGTNLQKDKK